MQGLPVWGKVQRECSGIAGGGGGGGFSQSWFQHAFSKADPEIEMLVRVVYWKRVLRVEEAEDAEGRS